MDITEFYRADLDELNAPDSPDLSMDELETRAFGKSLLSSNPSTAVVHNLTIVFRRTDN